VQADPSDNIVATSVYRYLLSRLSQVHDSGEMGAFAGPPGLGKTTAARKFIGDHGGEAALITLRFSNAKSVLVLQEVLAAVRRASQAYETHSPTNRRELQSALQRALEDWAWKIETRNHSPRPRMTIVFDEAQNLSPEAIETLRFWNDAVDGGHPVALAFLGNHQFRLETGSEGASFLSAAVRSRMSYRKTFSYQDLTDDDLTLLIEARGVVDPGAVELLLRHCRGSEINRDLRQLTRDLDALISTGEPVTSLTVRNMLGLS